MFGHGQFEQPRRIAGSDSGAGRQHELGQLRLLADTGGRRQIPRIQPGADHVDGHRTLRGQHRSRFTHGRRPLAIRLGVRGLMQQQPHRVEWIERLRSAFAETRVQVTNETTLGASRRLVVRGLRPLALNFANGIHPGGGFLKRSQSSGGGALSIQRSPSDAHR